MVILMPSWLTSQPLDFYSIKWKFSDTCIRGLFCFARGKYIKPQAHGEYLHNTPFFLLLTLGTSPRWVILGCAFSTANWGNSTFSSLNFFLFLSMSTLTRGKSSASSTLQADSLSIWCVKKLKGQDTYKRRLDQMSAWSILHIKCIPSSVHIEYMQIHAYLCICVHICIYSKENEVKTRNTVKCRKMK